MPKNNISEKTRLSFDQLGKSLDRLHEMLQRPLDTDRANIDASIQRFEFCIELFWKALKRLLSDLGQEATYPKEILREAYQGNLINDEQAWLAMLTDRNLTSHTYNEELADQIYEKIKTHYQVMRNACDTLLKRYF